ncbi:MAG: histidine triad nucleotide-binding protein [Opitutales bacterium]|nr:histidine triad nucleotide-binding protein [Opitutales bacterium]
MVSKTIFQKIIDRELPAEILFEDEQCIIIKDINPVAPVHVLVIPKKPILRVEEASTEDAKLLGHLLLCAKNFAKREGLKNGFRIVINNGKDALESVPHLHIHLIAGKPMQWPPC